MYLHSPQLAGFVKRENKGSVFKIAAWNSPTWRYSYRRKDNLACPRSGSANLFQELAAFSIEITVTYSLTITSGARLISALEPGVMRMNWRPIDRLAAYIYGKWLSESHGPDEKKSTYYHIDSHFSVYVVHVDITAAD